MSILDTRRASEVLIAHLEKLVLSPMQEDVLEKGRALVQNEALKNFFIEPGKISTRIAQADTDPILVRVEVPEVDDEVWEDLYKACMLQTDFLLDLYNARLGMGVVEHEAFSEISALVPHNMSFYISDQPQDIDNSEFFVALWVRFLKDLQLNPMSLFLLRGRSGEQFVHELRSLRKENLLQGELLQDEAEEFGEESEQINTKKQVKISTTAAAFYGQADIPPCSRAVKADELPAVLLKRLDHVPLVIQLEDIDSHLETAYERIARLSQSLARFL